MAHDERGFTLMETIVAFVIFAGVLIALERGVALGWHGLRLAGTDQAALELARAKLAATGTESPITEESDTEGTDGALAWRVSVRKYTPPQSVALPSRMAAYWVRVAVDWRDRPTGPVRTIALQTLKTGTTP